MAKAGNGNTVLSCPCGLGTSRTNYDGKGDHLQGPSQQAGYSAPARKVNKKSPVTMGYHVTSAAASPSSVKDLKSRA